MEKIFEPLKIKNLVLKNRFIVSAMVTMFNNKGDGSITEQFMAYHEQKAKGGFGLIITEDYTINPLAGAYPFLAGLYDDKFIAQNKEFTERIHRAGGKIVAQIYHAGRQSCSMKIANIPPVAPSPIKSPLNSAIPRELTVDEIHQLTKEYAQAARRAKEAGFDGVEIHGGHGYLLHNFVSPLSNKRTDQYGGNIHNRTRFSIEVVQAVRAVVGEDFPIFYRMSSMEEAYGGLNIEEGKTVAMLLEKAGIDVLHCSQGSDVGLNIVIPPACTQKAAYINNAAEMKKVLHIPVIGVGRINDEFLAEEIIRSGKADLVNLGRGSIADPYLPLKAKNGQHDDISHCIGCMQGCMAGGPGHTMTCTVNPLIGRESTLTISPTQTPQKIAVIGGGVSGCEAAIMAAQRGHQVTLFEKTERLGGQWLAAVVPVGKTDFADFLVWQNNQLNKYHVNVKLNTEIDSKAIETMGFDSIIVATGSKAIVPHNFFDSETNVVLANDALLGKCEVGQNVVVIGGGLTGSETAEFFAEHCRQVTLIEMQKQLAKDGAVLPRAYMLTEIKKLGIDIRLNTQVTQIANKTVSVKCEEHISEIKNVDTVILALGMKSENTLYNQLQAVGVKVFAVGDCNGVKNGFRNIREGFDLGVTI